VLRITRWQGIRYEIGFWATATTSRMRFASASQ
jgi:hypothetical protein